MDYIYRYNEWLSDEYFDEETKNELKGLNDEEIKDRFYKDLEFGTGGLRGKIGSGCNRMNIYTVRRASQGLSDYILKIEGGKTKGVAIAYDSRNMSREFADEAALTLAANGIKTYVFKRLTPTPELSFAVRELSCIAGIVITASHNPAEYNGYKVYFEDGAQITPPHDKNILECVYAINDYRECKTISKEKAIEAGLYNLISDTMDDKYVEKLKEQLVHPEIVKEMGEELKVVYTPLHGTGNINVRRVLKEIGIKNVYVVKEQEQPDGNFPTVNYPNPEDPDAFALALELAKKVDADIVLATDPDADRLGVFVKDIKTGDYVSFNGNVSGMLMAEYIFHEKKILGILPKKPAIVSTIVSTDMVYKLAKEYNASCFTTLTGFKYIGEKIKNFEKDKSFDFVFGFEESYGALSGTYARDKDACVAVELLVEMAAFYKSMGKTLIDAKNELDKKYGFYNEKLFTITLDGIEGLNKISKIMEDIRNNGLEKVGPSRVIRIRDYQTGIIRDIRTGNESSTNLPKSNVLYFELENDGWVCIRPSGTEPKIKVYIGSCEKSSEDAVEKVESLEKGFREFLY